MHKNKKSKRSFTLFEVLLVCMLLTVALGALGIQIPKLLRIAALERGASQLVTKINLAQEFMMDTQTDVTLILVHEKKSLFVTIQPEKPLAAKLKKNFSRTCEIKGVESFAFNGIIWEEKELKLPFDATVGAPPKGILTLKNKDQQTTLVLKGYPSRVKKGETLREDHEPPYPEEILSAL